MTDKFSPLDALEIGSTAMADTGTFGSRVIMPGLTHWKPLNDRYDVITANSSYLHQSNTNEASLGVSGSYGANGVAKVSVGLSAYVGRSKSDKSRSLSIDMTSLMVGGIELVDFDNLSLTGLIGGLAQNTQNELVNVLDAYREAVAVGAAHIDENGDPQPGLLETKEFRSWVEAQERFFLHYGDAIVIGIVWGGHGGVKLTFTESADEVAWKAGGKGKFNYSTVGASVQLSAAYGHTEMSNEQQKTGRIERFSSGKCIDGVIDAWEAQLNKTLQDESKDIGQTTLQSLEGKVPDVADPPKLKEPKNPNSNDVASKIGEIKDLQGLAAFAKASAYDAYRKEAGKNAKSLAEFLADAAKDNDTSGLPSGAVSPLGSDGSGENSRAAVLRANPPAAGPQVSGVRAVVTKDGDKTGEHLDLSAYNALGAWIVEWGQIFPWLVSAQDNSVSRTGDPETSAAIHGMLKLRTLRSDLMALSRIYDRLESENVRVKGHDLNFREMSNTFLSAGTRVLKFMQDHLSKLGGKYPAPEVDEKIDELIKGLGPYRKIYEVWCQTPVLREAELGFGLWILKMSSGWRPQGVKGLKDQGDLPDHGRWSKIRYENCGFDPNVDEPNFASFATEIKGWPAIMPNGEIVMFVSDPSATHKEKHHGSDSEWTTWSERGFLSASKHQVGGFFVTEDGAVGTKEMEIDGRPFSEYWNAVVFRPNTDFPSTEKPVPGLHANTVEVHDGKYDYRCRIFAFPIPFDAADGIEWEGTSPTPGLDDVKAQLSLLQQTLGGLKRWSFGSDDWSAADWRPEAPGKSLQSLKPMYVGLVPEPPSIFFNHSRSG